MLARCRYIKIFNLATFFGNIRYIKPIYNYEKNFTFNAGLFAGSRFCTRFSG